MVYLGTVAEWIIEFFILGTALVIWTVGLFMLSLLISTANDFFNKNTKENR